jgi:hypothetical protein
VKNEKPDSAISPDGLVELDETQLDHVAGGTFTKTTTGEGNIKATNPRGGNSVLNGEIKLP